MKRYYCFAGAVICALMMTISVSGSAKELTISEFKHIFMNGNLKNPDFKEINKPTILYFYADWCGPCRLFRPHVEKFVKENPDFDYFLIGESNKDTTGNYQKSKYLRNTLKTVFYPTVVVFDGNGSYFSFAGSCSYETLNSSIKAFLSGFSIHFSQELHHVSLFGRDVYVGDFNEDRSYGNGVIISAKDYFKGEIRNNKLYNGLYFDKDFNKKYIAGGNEMEKPDFREFQDSKSGLYGVLYSTGDTLVPAYFETLYRFYEGYAVAKYNGKYGAIDEAGHVLIPFSYDKLGSYNEGLAYYEIKQNDTVWSGYLDKFNNAAFYYYGENGVRKHDFSAGRAVINLGDFWNPKYIYVDKNGDNICGESSFEEAKPFHDGVALVGIKDSDGRRKYGYINWDGTYMTYPKYESAYDFEDGKAYVRLYEGWAQIDLSGKILRYISEDEAYDLML